MFMDEMSYGMYVFFYGKLKAKQTLGGIKENEE